MGSLRVDPDGQAGQGCHYIHLNLVRAKIPSIEQVSERPG
ncbi:MAG: hypothetical protein RL077_5546, partial [Verrucomicrobiota bacterium]